jgi:hypothetical protein
LKPTLAPDPLHDLAKLKVMDPVEKVRSRLTRTTSTKAILFAQLLSHERSCDLFRGQADANWKPTPGVFRQRDGLAKLRWKRFHDWALRQPLLDSIVEDQKKLAAVGQHYGIPTYLLDFTLNPRTAALFATHDHEIKSEKASIFCLWSGALDGTYHHYPDHMRYYEMVPQVERVNVSGLFPQPPPAAPVRRHFS